MPAAAHGGVNAGVQVDVTEPRVRRVSLRLCGPCASLRFGEETDAKGTGNRSFKTVNGKLGCWSSWPQRRSPPAAVSGQVVRAAGRTPGAASEQIQQGPAGPGLISGAKGGARREGTA